MGEASSVLADFKRYAELIRSQLSGAISFTPGSQSAETIQVERGIVYPRVVLDPKSVDLAPADRVIELAGSDRLASIAIVDAADHHRPVYTGLLIYSLLQTYAIAYETLSASAFGRWEEGLRPWCDML